MSYLIPSFPSLLLPILPHRSSLTLVANAFASTRLPPHPILAGRILLYHPVPSDPFPSLPIQAARSHLILFENTFQSIPSLLFLLPIGTERHSMVDTGLLSFPIFPTLPQTKALILVGTACRPPLLLPGHAIPSSTIPLILTMNALPTFPIQTAS